MNKVPKYGLSGLALMFAGFVGVANANTVLFNANSNGTPDSIFGISSVINGASMVGQMTVTVFFTNGTNSGPIAWSNTATCTQAGFCGQASGNVGNGVWTLTQSFNTGFVTNTASPDTSAVNPWTLTNTSSTIGIASVTLNGVVNASSGVLFDRDFRAGVSTGGQEGTPGSSFGVDYTFRSESGGGSPYTVTVTYSNIGTLLGPPQNCVGSNWPGNTSNGCEDVWGTLNFAFSTPFVAATTVTPTTWVFFQDTDGVVAPEPFTLGLSGLAIGALLLLRKYHAAKPSN